MKKNLLIAILFLFISAAILYIYKTTVQVPAEKPRCLTGAFLSDNPSTGDIISFKQNFGKRPFFVLVFIDWESFVDEKILENIFRQESAPVITWEPWYWHDKSGVSFNDILDGKFDDYIIDFAKKLKRFDGTIYLRFAHEMNGDWYPWSSAFIGPAAYRQGYRYIKDKFDDLGVDNIEWIFSINWENVPEDNDYRDSYPGSGYVDLVGIDGYNWGTSQPWSKWMSFREIFGPVCKQVSALYEKDIIIAEFSSSSAGGDKAQWISDALSDIKRMERVRGFILFNIDKETDWSFPPGSVYGEALKHELQDPYFLEGFSLGSDPN